MSQFIIEGGKKLTGEITVNGSKNAALPLLAAALLTREPVTLTRIPDILDVHNLVSIIESLGAIVVRDKNTITITAGAVDQAKLPYETVGKLRGSILLVGALLGRDRHVTIPQPGGDVIGARPIDVHLDGFEQLGATVLRDGDVLTVEGANMRAGTVVLREFSVTATENIMLAAATLPGTTVIHIAATEPHVVALAQVLNAMGARVSGAGTHTIAIEGATTLHGGHFVNIWDMLEAGFFMLLGAATQSTLRILNVPVDDLPLFFKKLDDIGVAYRIVGTTVEVTPAKLRSFKVQTMPQPGIATDLQAPFAVLATQATGASLIHDPMYESRFRHCDELSKMGAAITVCDPHRVIVEGPTQLRGRYIQGLDIRSGATLIMAGLVAAGQTVIDGAEIIDRGYERLDERLRAIGATIERVETGELDVAAATVPLTVKKASY